MAGYPASSANALLDMTFSGSMYGDDDTSLSAVIFIPLLVAKGMELLTLVVNAKQRASCVKRKTNAKKAVDLDIFDVRLLHNDMPFGINKKR